MSETITVLVSIGPHEKRYSCPDFRDMSAENAAAIIKKLNLKLATEGSGERVEVQKPEPGKQIRTGDTIYLKLY
jgi:beta-lactam-binding protein with PASTA domain